MSLIRETVEEVFSFEGRAPVLDFQFDSVCAWPILRWEILAKRQNPVAKSQRFINWLVRRKRSLPPFRKPEPLLKRFDALLAKVRHETQPAEIGILYDYGNRRPYAAYRGYHRILDSLVEICELQACVQGIELRTDATERSGLEIPLCVLSYEDVMLVHRLSCTSSSARDEDEERARKGYRSLRSIESSLFLNVNWMDVAKKLRAFRLYRRLFRDFLEVSRTRLALTICYYSLPAFAYAAACHDLGILCVEIQHGQQGDFHPMYSHWNAVPEGGYEVMPDVFWTWGELSQKRLETWTKQSRKHEVIVGGNPWLALRSSERSAADQRTDGKVKTILLSLQYSEIPDFVVEAANRLPGVEWLIRLHPRFVKDREGVRDFCRRAFDTGVEWEIDRATDADYYEILWDVDLQLTGWSTTAYEALHFGVPTILIHPNGRDAMREYLSRNIFQYADNADTLLELIVENRFEKEDEPYMVADPDVIRRRLSALRA